MGRIASNLPGNCPSLREVMRALCGARRFEIIGRLAFGEREVTLLALDLDLEISAVSHDLRILRRYGFVQLRKVGTRHVYRLTARIRVVLHAGHVWLEAQSDDGACVLLRSPELKLREAQLAAHEQVRSAPLSAMTRVPPAR